MKISFRRLLRQTVLIFFAVCLVMVQFITLASAEIGDSKNQVEQQYGKYYLIQDKARRILTPAEGQGLSGTDATSYGYQIAADGLNGTIWIEYNKQDKVVKETTIMDKSIKIRDFKNYFGNLYAELILPENAVFIVKAVPRDQLAVIVRKSPTEFNLIRFSLDNDGDNTKINMHSKIKSFEISDLSVSDAQNYLKVDKSYLDFDVSGPIVDPVGTWLRADNYFQPKLYFSNNLVPRAKTDMIVIHHAALDNMSVADIHELHLSKGWSGIGYHKVILSDGTIEEGRPEAMVGAHAWGVNPHSIGICLSGDFEKKRPAKAQLDALVILTQQLMKKYSIPITQIFPHRAVTPGTSCPGATFPWDEFIQQLKLAVSQSNI